MVCPLCGGDLKFVRESLVDKISNIYFCQSCPMVYALMKKHERAIVSDIHNRLGRRHAWNQPATS